MRFDHVTIKHIEDAITKGVVFLNSKQEDDGRWMDFELEVGRSTGWTTAYVATALSRRYEANSNVRRAGAWLLKNSRQGWGFNETVPTDCDSTAWGVLALLSAGINLPAAADELLGCYYDGKGLFRTFAGRHPDDQWGKGHLDVTVIALRALLTAGFADGKLLTEIATRIVEAGERGEWHGYWWQERMYTVSHALGTLNEFVGLLARIRRDPRLTPRFPDTNELAARIRAIHAKYRAQIQSQGFFSEPFRCALNVCALVHTRASAGALCEPVDNLLAGQEANGRWRGTAQVRVTIPTVARPWEHTNSGPLFLDIEDLFTTASVIDALTLVLRGSRRRAGGVEKNFVKESAGF